MIEYFKEEILTDAKKQKNKSLLIYLIFVGIYVAFSLVIVFLYTIQPYGSGKIIYIKMAEWVVSAIFVVFSFIYLLIKYKRVKKYYKLCFNLKTGLKEKNSAHYVGVAEGVSTKDGVDCKSLVFLEWNKYKKDFFERKVLVFEEREFPEFKENDNVRYVTQGNVLISYEILS